MTPQELRGWSGDILTVYANIESQRDWYWRQYLDMRDKLHETKNPIFLSYVEENLSYSNYYQGILNVMLDVKPAMEPPGRILYKYGEYPRGD